MAHQSATDSTPPPPQEQHSLTARLLAATAFSTVAAKIGLIGTIMDANALFDKKATLREKLIHSFPKLQQRVAHLQINEGRSFIGAYASAMKYSLIIGTVATVAGAALGWVRGGRVESWKDIIYHPLRSTLLVVGLKQPAQAIPAPAEVITMPGISTETDNSAYSHVAALQTENSLNTHAR